MGGVDRADQLRSFYFTRYYESKDKSQVNDFKASDDEGDKEEIESENIDRLFLNAKVTEEKMYPFKEDSTLS